MAARRSGADEELPGVPKSLEKLLLQQGEEEDFPLYSAESVHEFPSQGGIRANYQMHVENLEELNEVHPRLGKLQSYPSLLKPHILKHLRVTIHSPIFD